MSFLDYFTLNYMFLMTLSGLILLMFVNRKARIPATKLFWAAIMLLIVITVSDYFGAYYRSIPVSDPDVASAVSKRIIWNTISYILRPFIILIEVLVILPDKKYKYLCILPAVINGLIYSTRFFGSGIAFSISQINTFVGGPLKPTVFVVQIIYILLLLAFSVAYFRHNKWQSIMVLGILAQAAVAALGEYVFTFNYDNTNQVTALCILEYYIYLTAVHLRNLNDTALEKESAAVKSELLMLRNQIQPHFIYNTLNIIRSLIGQDKNKAVDCVDDFTQYLRTHIGVIKKNELIPFEEELESAKLYLSLVQIDYEDRLDLEYDLGTTYFVIPPLTLEPLIENAVKHGIGWGGGKITIRTYEDDERIFVQICDDGGTAADDELAEEFEFPHNGIGISNTRKRLELQCGGALRLDITDHGTIAEISLPKKACIKNEDTYC